MITRHKLHSFVDFRSLERQLSILTTESDFFHLKLTLYGHFADISTADFCILLFLTLTTKV